jgi:hypothetical protein
LEVDGNEVPFEKIVKGYEYGKDEFIVVTKEDLDAAATGAEKTITIESFANLSEVNQLHFYKPYLMEPEKGADHAYVCWRGAQRHRQNWNRPCRHLLKTTSRHGSSTRLTAGPPVGTRRRGRHLHRDLWRHERPRETPFITAPGIFGPRAFDHKQADASMRERH